MKYEILTLHRVGLGETWEPIPSDNEFDSEQEAHEMIESLRELGDDWSDAQYRVRPIALAE